MRLVECHCFPEDHSCVSFGWRRIIMVNCRWLKEPELRLCVARFCCWGLVEETSGSLGWWCLDTLDYDFKNEHTHLWLNSQTRHGARTSARNENSNLLESILLMTITYTFLSDSESEQCNHRIPSTSCSEMKNANSDGFLEQVGLRRYYTDHRKCTISRADCYNSGYFVSNIAVRGSVESQNWFDQCMCLGLNVTSPK